MATNLGNAVVNIDVNVNGMQNLNALGTQLRSLSSMIGRVKAAFRAGGQELAQFGINVRRVSFAMRDAGRQFLLFGGALAAALTAITVEGAKFEQGLANTVSVMSELQDKGAATTATIQELSDFFLRLAGDTVFTAEQITEAASELALAGFSVREVQDSMRGIADLAAAAGEDAASTAKSAAVILRSFKLDAGDINRVADTLTAAFTNSLNTLESLRESFKLVAPTASAFGLQLEDVATALGILGNTGLSGSIAGTGLSRLITQLATDVEAVDELLAGVGSSQANVDPLKNSLRDIIAEFERLIVSGKLTEAQLAGAFDQRAVRALLNLVSQGSNAFDDLNEKIENSAGLTKQIADTKLDTVIGQFTLLKSEMSILVTEIFFTFNQELKELLGTIKEYTNGLTEWVRVNNEFVGGLVKTTAVVSAVALALGGFLTVVGSLTAAIAGIIVVATFFTPLIGVFVSLSWIIAIVIGMIVSLIILIPVIGNLIVKLGQFLGLVRSDEDYAKSVREYADALEALSARFDDAIDRASEFASKSQKAVAILSNLGTATSGEIKVVSEIFKELGITSSADLKAEGNRIYDEYVAIIDDVNAKIEAANAGEIELDTVQIASLKSQADALLGQAKSLSEQFKDFESIEDVLFKTDPAKFEEVKKNYSDQLDKLQQQRRVLARRDNLTDPEKENLKKLEAEIEAVKNARNLLASFSAETFKVFRSVASNSSQLVAGVEAVDAYSESLAQAAAAQAEFEKKVKESGEAFEESLKKVKESSESSLEKKIRELNESAAELVAAYDQFIMGVANPVARAILQSAKAAALNDIQKQKDDLFKEQAADRANSVRDLELERAKFEKDVTKAKQLLKEDRDAERDKRLEDDFTVPANAAQAQIDQNNKDRLAFINEYDLATQRLLDNLEEELTKTDEVKEKVEKITRKESERNEIEKSIAQQLTNQVKSIEDAQAVLRFARGEQERRFREARSAARDEAVAENRLFESIKKRAELEAKGQDLTAINRRIRLQEKLRQVEADRRNVLEGQTGAKKQREDTFKQDLEQIEKEAAELGKKIREENLATLTSSVKAVADVLSEAPKVWVDILIKGWSDEIPRFIQSVLALGFPSLAAIPGVSSTSPGLEMQPNGQVALKNATYNDNKVLTFNINEASDADAVARAVQDKLFKTPPRFVV